VAAKNGKPVDAVARRRRLRGDLTGSDPLARSSRNDQSSAHGGDGILDVTFRPQWRIPAFNKSEGASFLVAGQN
jgi:hypothetical protein